MIGEKDKKERTSQTGVNEIQCLCKQRHCHINKSGRAYNCEYEIRRCTLCGREENRSGTIITAGKLIKLIIV